MTKPDADTQATEDKTPDEIREEIAETREQLGDTVEALAAKTDVKGQAKAKVEEVKADVRDKAESIGGKAKEATPETAVGAGQAAAGKVKANPLPVAIVAALVIGYLVGRARR